MRGMQKFHELIRGSGHVQCVRANMAGRIDEFMAAIVADGTWETYMDGRSQTVASYTVTRSS